MRDDVNGWRFVADSEACVLENEATHSEIIQLRPLSPGDPSPSIVKLEDRTTRLLSDYQVHVQQQWAQRWSDEDADNRPPLIETQELRLLLETQRPQRYLHPEYFRVGRATRSAPREQDLGQWATVDRGELARNDLANADGSHCDLSRLVITTDAGIGKTIAMQWLESELNQPGGTAAAFYFTFSRLPSDIDELLPNLSRRILPSGSSGGELPLQVNAVRMLESLRRQGRLILLLDALDQEPADGSAALLVRQLLDEPAWRACRIVISGRPYALQWHWSQLFSPELGFGWRFVQVDAFTPDEQRRFLGSDGRGKARIDLIPEEAREILSTPRVLSYLRNLADADLRKIRTTGDVYWLSIQQLLIEGMQGSEAALRIGLEATEPTPARVQARSKRRAVKLLAAIAFEMTSTLISRADAAPGQPTKTPNFDGVPGNRFQRFGKRLQRRLSPGGEGTDADSRLDRDLDGLAALNDFISQGFFDTTVEGLQEVYWRNRSLQEFFTALWLVQYGTEQDASLLSDWLYQPDRPWTEEYYWISRFVSEMHTDGRDPDAWLRAVAPIYRPGDDTIAGTPRSSEFIYRAWEPLQALIGEGEPLAAELRDRFLGEFEDKLLSGDRGEPTRQIAQQLCDSFIEVRAGEFRMGAPPEKQGMDEELRAQWKAYLEQDGEPAERARQQIANWSFTPGKRGEKDRREWLEWWTEVFRDRDLKRLQERYSRHDESPAEAIQKIDTFCLCRYPTLNAWYRLFVPGHGEVESIYFGTYQSVSPTPESPVIFVSWYDAWAFALWAHCQGRSCRLPREYEWEYAAKADSPWDQNYWWGDEFDADKCNAEGHVGRAVPPTSAHVNPWGFEDILGNVWEWCEDWYRREYDRKVVDGGSIRMLRGGSWSRDARYCRSAFRYGIVPEYRSNSLGFRVATVPSSRAKQAEPGSGGRGAEPRGAGTARAIQP